MISGLAGGAALGTAVGVGCPTGARGGIGAGGVTISTVFDGLGVVSRAFLISLFTFGRTTGTAGVTGKGATRGTLASGAPALASPLGIGKALCTLPPRVSPAPPITIALPGTALLPLPTTPCAPCGAGFTNRRNTSIAGRKANPIAASALFVVDQAALGFSSAAPAAPTPVVTGA